MVILLHIHCPTLSLTTAFHGTVTPTRIHMHMYNTYVRTHGVVDICIKMRRQRSYSPLCGSIDRLTCDYQRGDSARKIKERFIIHTYNSTHWIGSRGWKSALWSWDNYYNSRRDKIIYLNSEENVCKSVRVNTGTSRIYVNVSLYSARDRAWEFMCRICRHVTMAMWCNLIVSISAIRVCFLRRFWWLHHKYVGAMIVNIFFVSRSRILYRNFPKLFDFAVVTAIYCMHFARETSKNVHCNGPKVKP